MASLSLTNVCIDYPVFGAHATSLKRTVVAAVTGGMIGRETGVTTIHALQDITLTLRKGDRLGIMGHNGAGKTTLLRTLAGVYPPTKGRYRRQGSLSSLIDPMLGVEMEFSGYENIRLCGILKGLNSQEIAALTPEIAEFSGLGEYLDMPVRTYSTGMLMRLAFSIATTVRAEILIMDEWLSVGDASFRQKSEQRIRDVVDAAGILVLASQSRHLIEKECNRFVELSHGKIVRDEPIGPGPDAAVPAAAPQPAPQPALTPQPKPQPALEPQPAGRG
jgi:lipopolysaccharide transport system ATP-binding protein